MPFTDILSKYEKFDAEGHSSSIADRRIERALGKTRLDADDYFALLSPAADNYLEAMAQRARDVTRAQFGNVIMLFTPLYVSNICDNVCPYCSFARQHKIRRRHLGIDEVRREAEYIAKTGMRHILMLTGESRKGASIRYLRDCADVLREYFSSLAIEVYPLEAGEYEVMAEAGVDGLTIYQETYDRGIYERLHRGGPKEDFEYRLSAPERASRAGIRAVTVGPLLGLAPSLKDAFLAGLHAAYLREKFPSLEIAVSFPRIRPLAGEFETRFGVDDKTFVRYMTAFRLFMPSAGITVSTRESRTFRDAVLPMGPTKMSAGVSTSVGASSGEASESQFEIADERSVDEMKNDLLSKGFQPVMVDWNYTLSRFCGSGI